MKKPPAQHETSVCNANQHPKYNFRPLITNEISSESIKITHALRRYALAIVGSNSIALFASETASARQNFKENNYQPQNQFIRSYNWYTEQNKKIKTS